MKTRFIYFITVMIILLIILGFSLVLSIAMQTETDIEPSKNTLDDNIYSANQSEATEDKISDAERLFAVAKKEVGRNGGAKYNRWYGLDSDEPWCAVFVLWCFGQAELIDRIGGKSEGYEYPYTWWEWYSSHGKAYERDSEYTPKPGDIVFFDWNENDGKNESGNYNPDNFNHIEIVEKVVGDMLYLFGGNTGGGRGKVAYRDKYKLTDSAIIGYGENNLSETEDDISVYDTVIDLSNIVNADNGEERFVFIYNNTVIYLGEYIEHILTELEPATEYYEYDSCSFEGIAKIYSYSGFEISTYLKNKTDRDRVYSVNFYDDSVSTVEGIRIGQTYNDMIKSYGTGYKMIPEIGLYMYIKNGTVLSFKIEDNIIAAISYEIEDIYE